MNRDEFAQAIRTACAHLGEPYVVVFGSQSILGSYDSSALPLEASLSREVDISPGSAFATGVDVDDKLSVLDVFVGEDSPFHDMHGVFVEGIHKDTVVLPHGWDNRLVHFTASDVAGAEYGRTGLCLDPVDLCVSKCIAGRDKDRTFVSALVRDGIIDPADVLERISTAGIQWPSIYTDDRELAVDRATSFLESLSADVISTVASEQHPVAEDYRAVLGGLAAGVTGHPRHVRTMLNRRSAQMPADGSRNAHSSGVERDQSPDLGL